MPGAARTRCPRTRCACRTRPPRWCGRRCSASTTPRCTAVCSATAPPSSTPSAATGSSEERFSMPGTYNVIDADGHVLEPVDLFEKYMDPAYRNRAPRMIVDTDGKERLLIEGRVLGSPKGLGLLGAIGARQGTVDDVTMKYREGRKGGFDPHARIADMDLDGIDAAFLYPSIGLFAGAIKDPGLAAAACRAYNRWLADYCRPYPDRLFGVAMLPMQSIEFAIDEMRYAHEQLGMRGGFLRPNPYNGRMLHHPDYAPFRAEGRALRQPGLQRLGALHASERAVPAQLLDLVRARRGLPQRARGLHRSSQDPVGARLPASRRLLPRCAEADRRPAGAVGPDQARDPGRGRTALLRADVASGWLRVETRQATRVPLQFWCGTDIHRRRGHRPPGHVSRSAVHGRQRGEVHASASGRLARDRTRAEAAGDVRPRRWHPD